MSLIKKIKQLFEEIDVVDEVKFVDLKSVDGAILRVSDLAVGASIVEITEDGEVPLEDGEYKLDDGVVLVVEAGVIAEIKEAEAEAEDDEGLQEFYDVMFKDGGVGNVINSKDNEINVGDKLMSKGVEVGPGEYELNTGQKLFVGEAGVINSIENAVADEVIDEVDETVDETAPEVVETNEDVEAVMASIRGVVEQLAGLKAEFESLNSKFSSLQDENSMLRGEVAKFAELPSEKPTDTKIKFKAQSKDEKLKFFSKR